MEPLQLDRNVYNTVTRAIKSYSTIDAKEVKQIEKAVHQDGKVTEDEQKLLDGIKSQADTSNVLQIKTSDMEPVYEITTFPSLSSNNSENFIHGKVVSAPYEVALREFKKDLAQGYSTRCLDWLASNDSNKMLAELSPRELDKLVKLATKPYADAEIPGSHLLRFLTEKLNPEGLEQLKQKLSPKSWNLIMAEMAKLPPEDQAKLAAVLGTAPPQP